MTQKKTPTPQLSDHELNEIRARIEERSGILLDASRERFFSMHIREHMRDRRAGHGAQLLRTMNASNVTDDPVLQRLLPHETSFFRDPAVTATLYKHVLPEMRATKF